jgi:hypothetical protein
MQSVEVRLPTRALSNDLVSMREWLDGRGFAPSVFRYDTNAEGSEAVVCLTFRIEIEAVEFAKEFSEVGTPASRVLDAVDDLAG